MAYHTRAEARRMTVKEALGLIEDTIDDAERIPPIGADFAESVTAKLADIAATIEASENVTEGQETAIQNMAEGGSKWTERR